MPENIRESVAALCDTWIGTKHDVMNELFVLHELIDSPNPPTETIDSKCRVIQRMLGEPATLSAQVVNALQETCETEPACELALMLLMESAANVLNAIPAWPTTEDTGGRLRDVLDPWQDMRFLCPHCGRETPGKDLATGNMHDTFFSCDCPACGNNVVSIERPHVTELMNNIDNLPTETAVEVRTFAEQCARWQKEKLHCVEQLPDIDLDHIVLVWDADRNGHENTELYTEIVIRCGEREIYRGPSSWEYDDYFIDACKVLRRKYGNRLHDVIPTERTFCAMWGDKLRAPEIVEGMRERIRNASRIGNWPERPIDPGHSWENYPA
jgi:hypothetical protein